MIKPKYFNHENFNPICIDGVTVQVEIKNLAALSPSFPPTPTKRQPPDGNILHAQLMKFKRSLACKVHFRRKDFKQADTLEDFINMEHQLFVKHPWYIPSTKSPPPLPFLLDEAFSNVYRTVMDPANWYHYSQNVTLEMRIAISKTRALPSQGVGVYCQDKSLLHLLLLIVRWKLSSLMKQSIRNWIMTMPPSTNPKFPIGTEDTNLPSSLFLMT